LIPVITFSLFAAFAVIIPVKAMRVSADYRKIAFVDIIAIQIRWWGRDTNALITRMAISQHSTSGQTD